MYSDIFAAVVSERSTIEVDLIMIPLGYLLATIWAHAKVSIADSNPARVSPDQAACIGLH
jgi:hypothetical protein